MTVQCAKEAYRKKKMLSLGFGAVLELGMGTRREDLQKKVPYKQSL